MPFVLTLCVCSFFSFVFSSCCTCTNLLHFSGSLWPVVIGIVAVYYCKRTNEHTRTTDGAFHLTFLTVFRSSSPLAIYSVHSFRFSLSRSVCVNSQIFPWNYDFAVCFRPLGICQSKLDFHSLPITRALFTCKHINMNIEHLYC